MSKKKAIAVTIAVLLACAMTSCSFSIQNDAPDDTSASAASAVALHKAAWTDNECLTYEVIQQNQRVGTAKFKISKPNGSTYELKKTKTIDGNTTTSGATFDARSFLPQASYFFGRNVRIETEYGSQWNVDVSAKERHTTEHSLPNGCYDNESLLMILRSFKLQKEKPIRIDDAIPETMRIEPLEIEWTGVEKITTPYAERTCKLVKIGDKVAWYSTDVHCFLMQYRDGDMVYKLTSVSE